MYTVRAVIIIDAVQYRSLPGMTGIACMDAAIRMDRGISFKNLFTICRERRWMACGGAQKAQCTRGT